ncbi:hypothetical protein B0T18DRAFT_147550 [Schizothecium vesticola]|uniref:Uncharacterized protein n=1 Tax=Schizothecium vesticola TaxID=314040 RepID=A0AA40EVJ8_9PEZI|nr:hypothetical protein B0T18DRAFT_147550 [Schizothecium vesticola]
MLLEARVAAVRSGRWLPRMYRSGRGMIGEDARQKGRTLYKIATGLLTRGCFRVGRRMPEQAMRKEVYRPGAACNEEVVQACGEHEVRDPTNMDRFMALGGESFVSTDSQKPQGRVGERPRGPLLSMARCWRFLCDGGQAEAELHFEAGRELEELGGTTTWRRVGRRPQEVMRRRRCCVVQRDARCVSKGRWRNRRPCLSRLLTPTRKGGAEPESKESRS